MARLDIKNCCCFRLVMLKGSSGFYCYAILQHPSGWPALSIAEARLAFKLNPAKYKQAVLLVHPIEPQFKGEVLLEQVKVSD